MNRIQQGFRWSHMSRVCLIFSAAIVVVSVPSMVAKTKPTEVPAKVIAHVVLQEAPGNEMLLQKRGDKEYLYVQKASKKGFMVIDVAKPSLPSLVRVSAPSNDATAGKLEMAGPDVAIAEVPDRNSKGVIRSTDNPTETVNVLDLSDPTHPKVLQTFVGVTSILPDPGRGLIYLANNDGLWILSYTKQGMTPSTKKRPCGSEDALAAMPPDCE
jgi:LVIVD repeat